MGKIKTDELALLQNRNLTDDEYMHLLYNICFDYVQEIIGFITHNPQDAFDVTQEAYIQALLEPETLRSHPMPHRWLVRTARNIAGKNYRSEQQRWKSETNATEKLVNSLGTERSVSYGDIRKYLKKLSSKDEKLLFDFYFKNASMSELAQERGISEATVQRRLSRARVKFRKILEKTEIFTFLIISGLILTFFGISI